MPEYHEVSNALRNADVDIDAADCHGSLCGVLVVNAAVPVQLWLDEVLSEADSANALVRETRALLETLCTATREQLNSSNLDFQLLLPGDDCSLQERAGALALWCRGFLFGTALAGVKADTSLPADSAELFKDLAEIVKLGIGEIADEEDENAYTEILEYVRMGVLLVNEELQPMKLQASIH